MRTGGGALQAGRSRRLRGQAVPQAGLPLSAGPPAPAAAWEGISCLSSQTNLHPKPRVSGPCLTRPSILEETGFAKRRASAQEGTLSASASQAER